MSTQPWKTQIIKM